MALAASKKMQLAEQEEIIRKTVRAMFVDVGSALRTIRDGELYKIRYNATFEEYCEERWSFTRQRAYQLIDAVKVIEAMSTRVDIDKLPTTEGQVRALASLKDPEQIPQVWRAAQQNANDGKNPTVKQVQAAVLLYQPTEATRARWDEQYEREHGMEPQTVLVKVISTGEPEPPKVARLLVTQGEPSRDIEDKAKGGESNADWSHRHLVEGPIAQSLNISTLGLKEWVEHHERYLVTIPEVKDVPSGIKMLIEAIEEAATKYEDETPIP
jgi:hypothetical protein